MQPRQIIQSKIFDRLNNSIENLHNEIEKSNKKEEVPISLQNKSAKYSIAGFFASTLLTIIIFLYTCNTATDVKGMADLLKKQDTAIHKQDTALWKQDSLNGNLHTSIKLLTELLSAQGTQIDVNRSQLNRLKILVEESNQLNKINILQNENLTAVLKGIEKSYQVQYNAYSASKRFSYFTLLDSIKAIQENRNFFDSVRFDKVIVLNNGKQELNYAWLLKLRHEIGLIKPKIKNIQSNTFLFYDSLAQDKFLGVYITEYNLERVASGSIYVSPSPMGKSMDVPLLIRSIGDFRNTLKDFTDYIRTLEYRYTKR